MPIYFKSRNLVLHVARLEIRSEMMVRYLVSVKFNLLGCSAKPMGFVSKHNRSFHPIGWKMSDDHNIQEKCMVILFPPLHPYLPPLVSDRVLVELIMLPSASSVGAESKEVVRAKSPRVPVCWGVVGRLLKPPAGKLIVKTS